MPITLTEFTFLKRHVKRLRTGKKMRIGVIFQPSENERNREKNRRLRLALAVTSTLYLGNHKLIFLKKDTKLKLRKR